MQRRRRRYSEPGGSKEPGGDVAVSGDEDMSAAAVGSMADTNPNVKVVFNIDTAARLSLLADSAPRPALHKSCSTSVLEGSVSCCLDAASECDDPCDR